MRSDRVARALLRLYPRAWRERYGAELLALIAEQGLSTSAVFDVVAAAVLERTRSLAALLRNDLDPQTACIAPVPFRETLRESAWFLCLIALMVGIVVLTGIPLPSWMWWYFTVINWVIGAWVTTRPLASSSERAVLAFFWNALAVAGARLAWLIASVAAWLGVPEPPEYVVYGSFGLFFAAVACRGIYSGSRIHVTTWMDLHPHEIAVWRGVLFVIVVLAAFLDPKAETFWSLSLVMAISFQVPHNAMRHFAARQRPPYERSEETWAFKKTDRS
jgi:hypothetical protein